jgi:hypothetical protein
VRLALYVVYKVGKWLGKEGRNACHACARSKAKQELGE